MLFIWFLNWQLKIDIHIANEEMIYWLYCILLYIYLFLYRYALVLVDKTKQLSKEKKRTDSLLYQLVPKQVADKLKTQKGVDAEYFKSVTILFSDICGFSQITLALEPMNIVKLLNALYEAIDELLEERNVYKVETINDSYMVVSGRSFRIICIYHIS